MHSVVQLVVEEGSEVQFHHWVLPLSLTHSLWVESSRESVIDTEVGTNTVPKATGKLIAMIGCEIVWHTAFADHMFEIHLC